MDTPKIRISIDNIKMATQTEPAKVTYTIIIYRENGRSEIRGAVPIGDSFDITEDELAGN